MNYPIEIKVSESFWREANEFLPSLHLQSLNKLERGRRINDKWGMIWLRNEKQLDRFYYCSEILGRYLRTHDCPVMGNYCMHLCKNLKLIKQNLQL